jgi:hypothetical protein
VCVCHVELGKKKLGCSSPDGLHEGVRAGLLMLWVAAGGAKRCCRLRPCDQQGMARETK